MDNVQKHNTCKEIINLYNIKNLTYDSLCTLQTKAFQEKQSNRDILLLPISVISLTQIPSDINAFCSSSLALGFTVPTSRRMSTVSDIRWGLLYKQINTCYIWFPKSFFAVSSRWNLVPKINIFYFTILNVFPEVWRFYIKKLLTEGLKRKEIITRQVPVESDLTECCNEEFKL
jgi:hypothetical protein